MNRTQGTWVIGEKSPLVVFARRGLDLYLVADCRPYDPRVTADEAKANAKLTAAAGELYDAAELALEELDPEGKAAQALARAIEIAKAGRR
jgi:hypothetical protein